MTHFLNGLEQVFMKRKKTVIIDFDIVGFHYYPDAPDQVAFLENNHRHLFQIKVGYDVSFLNREKEIFIQADFVKEYLTETYGSPCNFKNMSCEMIADEILTFAKDDNAIWVEVLEDGKGGAKIEL